MNINNKVLITPVRLLFVHLLLLLGMKRFSVEAAIRADHNECIHTHTHKYTVRSVCDGKQC